MRPLGRKRDQGGGADYAKIDPIEGQIHFAEALEHVVMIEPDYPYVDKRDGICQIGRPPNQKFFAQSSLRRGWAMNFPAPAM
jgi:hypothetical protein